MRGPHHGHDPGSGPTEEALMQAYAGGEAGAFDTLFARVAPAVYGFFVRSFRDPSVAEDLLQTTFLKVHRSRRSYRGGRFRPWLFTIAARVRVDELRRRGVRREDPGDEALEQAERASPVEDAAALHERSEIAARVKECLDRLPETQRIVVHLHRYEGLTFGEIAGILEMSEVAVRQRAFRAYNRLREELAPVLSGGKENP